MPNSKNTKRPNGSIDKIVKRFLRTDEQVLYDLLSLGKSNAVIAEMLAVNPRTVRRRKNALIKLLRAYAAWVEVEREALQALENKKGKVYRAIFTAHIHRIPLARIAADNQTTPRVVRDVLSESHRALSDVHSNRAKAINQKGTHASDWD